MGVGMLGRTQAGCRESGIRIAAAPEYGKGPGRGLRVRGLHFRPRMGLCVEAVDRFGNLDLHAQERDDGLRRATAQAAFGGDAEALDALPGARRAGQRALPARSEERREGYECVSTENYRGTTCQ